MTMNSVFKASAITLILALSTPQAWAKTEAMLGEWRINQEETDKVRVAFKEGSGIKTGPNLRPNISVGGLPLPRVGGSQGPLSNLSAKDPTVLRCSTMQIQPKGEKLTLIYDGADKETLVKGKHRGRKTSWSGSKIEQRYKTTERSVKKTWTLRDDGRLEVAVKINPRGDRAQTHKRVFDRVTTQTLAEDQPGENSQDS